MNESATMRRSTSGVVTWQGGPDFLIVLVILAVVVASTWLATANQVWLVATAPQILRGPAAFNIDGQVDPKTGWTSTGAAGGVGWSITCQQTLEGGFKLDVGLNIFGFGIRKGGESQSGLCLHWEDVEMLLNNLLTEALDTTSLPEWFNTKFAEIIRVSVEALLTGLGYN